MKAVITGITGQDGSYLAEFLLGKEYEVIGLKRRTSTPNFKNIEHIIDKIEIVEGDITDKNVTDYLAKKKPDEFYNLAAQSDVAHSFKAPYYTTKVNYLGVLNCLESIREHSTHITRFFQASTSEMFGRCSTAINEQTPVSPVSPYAVAKTAAHHLVESYRGSYGLFACCGITFNHESPRRGDNFVTKKICNYLKGNKEVKLQLGDLSTYRDWGYAKEYVEAFWEMLRSGRAKDYVIATGETYSIREFLDISFGRFNLDWRDYVESKKYFMRPYDVKYLLGDPEKIRANLGWKAKTNLENLIDIMLTQ